jgi:hypothetical protein
MAVGQEDHLHHGRAVVAAHRLEQLGYLLVFLGVSIGTLALIWWLAAELMG